MGEPKIKPEAAKSKVAKKRRTAVLVFPKPGSAPTVETPAIHRGQESSRERTGRRTRPVVDRDAASVAVGRPDPERAVVRPRSRARGSRPEQQRVGAAAEPDQESHSAPPGFDPGAARPSRKREAGPLGEGSAQQVRWRPGGTEPNLDARSQAPTPVVEPAGTPPASQRPTTERVPEPSGVDPVRAEDPPRSRPRTEPTPTELSSPPFEDELSFEDLAVRPTTQPALDEERDVRQLDSKRAAEPGHERAVRRGTLPVIPRSLASDEEIELDNATELAPGCELPHSKSYDIVERVAEGGMGKIYRAFDPVMDRYVALKVLKLDVPESERSRFRNEAVVAANFSHPNLARVLDRGTWADSGIEWITMEYLRGRDLGEIIDNTEKIAFPILVDIIGQTLDALAYIHQRKIVHCDVKPDNIFVTRDVYDRRIVTVKLIDFGVCRNISPPMAPQSQLIGDPRYMAPEQTVLNGPMDQRVDLYALGLTFFEALIGRHPFQHADELTALQLLQLQNYSELPKPSSLVSDVPGELAAALDEFVGRACAKDPAGRYPDAPAMRQALDALPEPA